MNKAAMNTVTDAPSAVEEIVTRQRSFFRTGATLAYAYRRRSLDLLRDAIRSREDDINAALWSDLHKGAFETYTSEIGILYDEIRHTKKHLKRWMKSRRVGTPITHAPASSRVIRRPRGVTGIIAPWNYPFQLAIAPLIPAVAAGNTAIVKPSELAPATSAVIQRLIEETFDPAYIACVTGEGSVAAELTAAPLDHIFYTGSTAVGRLVMKSAAERLTPVTLELGGKSPAIVSEAASLEVAARRVAWGRFLNAGQTCVAVDYVCVHRSVHQEFLTLLAGVIDEFYQGDPAASEDFGRIINDRHFQRLSEVIERRRSAGSAPDAVIGGTLDPEERYIAPTVFSPVDWEDPLMEDEIFGPILPVLVYDEFDEVIETIASRPTPLAAYLFSEDRREMRAFEDRLPFGGATINDTVVHLVNPELPFGGSGPSGHGSYHGEAGFRTFSHEASVMRRSTKFDLPLKYPPYGNALGLIKRIMRP